MLTTLQQEKIIIVKSSQGSLGESGYANGITGQGILRAREAMETSQHAGPAPVPFEVYNEAICRQKSGRITGTTRTLCLCLFLSQLVISESTFQYLGINSGSSIFMYAPPRNRKTSISRAFGTLVLSQSMYILHALYLDGQGIKVNDAVRHTLAPESEGTSDGSPGGLRTTTRRAPRWVKIRRPFVVIAGELTLEVLDFVFDDTIKFF